MEKKELFLKIALGISPIPNWGGQHINFGSKKKDAKVKGTLGYNYALGVLPLPYVGADIKGKKRIWGAHLNPTEVGWNIKGKGKDNKFNDELQGSGGPRSLWKTLKGGKSTD